MPNLNKRTVDAAKPGEKRAYIWDSALKGFGLLVMPSGVKSFVVQYRTGAGRSRRLTLGRYGPLTPDQARKMAADTLGLIRNGADPVAQRQALRAAPTVNELMSRYLTEHVAVHNARSTRIEAERLVEKIIGPKVGALKAADVTRQDIAKLHRALSETPRQANLVLAVLSKAFALSEVWGVRPENSNPVRLIKRYREAKRDRFLSADELARLGRTLDDAETVGLPWSIKAKGETAKHLPPDEDDRRTLVNPVAIAAIRLLLLTGARLSEVLELRWDHIDFVAGTIDLPSYKGAERRPHPVSTAALTLLGKQPQSDDSSFVFPNDVDPTRNISVDRVEKIWHRIRKHAAIDDVRLHDLRHTVGTYASQTGSNAFMIRNLLRHENITVTNRYVNRDADPVRELSEIVGRHIVAGLNGRSEQS